MSTLKVFFWKPWSFSNTFRGVASILILHISPLISQKNCIWVMKSFYCVLNVARKCVCPYHCIIHQQCHTIIALDHRPSVVLLHDRIELWCLLWLWVWVVYVVWCFSGGFVDLDLNSVSLLSSYVKSSLIIS